MESGIWVDILALSFPLVGFVIWVSYFINELKEKKTMKEEKNDTASQYTTLVLNNHIDDVVKFQECMIKGLLETSSEWEDDMEFMVMKRFHEDILTVLKSVQSTSEIDDSEEIEYMPLGFRTDDIN